MNFVPRTSLRWTRESYVGGNEGNINKIQKNERGSKSICTVSKMSVFLPFNSSRLEIFWSFNQLSNMYQVLTLFLTEKRWSMNNKKKKEKT